MPRKKKEEPTIITIEDGTQWYTAGVGAKRLSINSGRTVPTSYITKLGNMGKIPTRKIHDRLTLYSKPAVDAYRVEERGAKSGQAARQKSGRTGPTVRQERKAKKSQPAA